MKIVGENDSNEAKLLEEKRKEMNDLIGLNNISIKEDITLLISNWCSEHIRTLHKEYPHTEWLAVCKIEPQGKWVFLMTDMVFPWQKGVGWEVETTEEWMERLNKELISRNENWKLWNCILHSHHSMWVFWSGTDDNARLGMNDWRQVEWAVVTAYDKDEISYKGCINFYKPYNIEIDVDVKEAEWVSITQKYAEYITKIKESSGIFYDALLKENEEYINSITETPSYSNMLEYLWIDISKELAENYDKVKDKIWNPELIDYMKQLGNEANELARNEVNKNGEYTDMLTEYDAFCQWSDNLLTQLEENRKTKSTSYQWSLISSTAYPLNRDFDDDDYDYNNIYEFTGSKYAESYVRSMFRIDSKIPMKMWDHWEWLVYNYYYGEYVYVEEWADGYDYYY